MSGSGIYIDINGTPTDLKDVSWYEKAPCGCTSGAHVAFSDRMGRSPALVIATAEQARMEMWETKAERDRQDALGFSIYPDLRSKGVELMAECQHEPRYGYPPRPQLDGYEWSADRSISARSSLMHLVPKPDGDHLTRRKPLCGGGAKWAHWSAEDHHLLLKTECPRCEKKARKGVQP